MANAELGILTPVRKTRSCKFVLVSIIVPALNEEACIGATIAAVMQLRGSFELIVVDGGSTDRTVEIAAKSARVVNAQQGRGIQQAAGADVSRGDVLWFLHADSMPSSSALDAIRTALKDQRVSGGNFSLCFDGNRQSARHLTVIYPYLRFLGLCYGDSGIFIRRSVYNEIGGFRPYPLFEDIDLVRRIRRHGRFQTVTETLVTSSRRFEDRNFASMFAEWTALQALYWLGISPNRLARIYSPIRRP